MAEWLEDRVVNIPSGEGTGTQVTYLPSSLPPVAGPSEAVQAELPKNLQATPTETLNAAARFKGELPAEPKSAVEQALAGRHDGIEHRFGRRIEHAQPFDFAKSGGLIHGCPR